MDYDSLGCTFLCSAPLGERYLTRLLENHVGKFVHSHAGERTWRELKNAHGSSFLNW